MDGRISTVGRSALRSDEIFIVSPTTADEEKMPDRTISTDRRILRDGRLPSLFTHKCDYRRPDYTKIEDIANRIATLSRSYHGVNSLINKRDIKSAFKLARIHPDGVKLPTR